jgi:hypothetical protein
MKKLLLGAIVLLLFAVSISIVQSCQKIQAQANRPQSPASTGTILFTKETLQSITPPVTVTHTNDSTGYTYTTITPADTIYGVNLYVCNIDGSNIRQIPLPTTMSFDIFHAKLTAGADSIVISDAVLLDESGLYTCAIDGSGFKQIIPDSYKAFIQVNDVK